MTVLTKASILVKKPDITEAPLVHDNICDEEKIDIHPPVTWSPPKRSAGGLFCMSITAIVMAITGITCGLMLYRHYLRSTATLHRYSGFCSIPLDNKQEAQELQWQTDPDVQLFTNLMEDITADAFHEKVDIGDTYEKIVVIDNGHQVEFIHDFNSNVTGIVDSVRCYMMDLEPGVVEPPARLARSLSKGGRFDVSRVRSALRAELSPPPRALLAQAALVARACLHKPTYVLRAPDAFAPGIRKRSAEDPPHDFLQFSGKHVQEIHIQNMPELLAFEAAHGRQARSIIAY